MSGGVVVDKGAPTPSPMGRLIKNSGFILASQVWFTLLSLIATPYIVRTMGVDSYGVFAILLVFIGYLSYLDLGLGWALIKFVAEHEAKGDEEILQRSVATVLFTLILGGLVGAGLLIGLSDLIVRKLLNLPPALVGVAKSALWISAATFALNSPVGALNALLRGLQRFEITSVLQTVFGTASILGTVWVLHKGYGLREVVLVYAVMGFCGLVAHVFVIRRLKPAFSLLPWLDVREFRRMFSFSLFTTFNKLAITAIFQMDKFFIAYFLPVAYLSYYTIPFNIAQKLNLIASNAATVMFPLASQQFSVNNLESYKRVYHRAVKVVFLLTAVPAAVLIAFSKNFLRVWLGLGFETQGSVPLMLLSVAFAVNSISSVEAVSIEGAGRPRVTAAFLAISGLVNLILCPILTSSYGISGTAASLAASLALLAGMNITYFNTELMRSTLLEAIGKNYVRSLIIFAFALPGAYVIAQFRVSNLMILLVIMAVVVFVICSLGLWVLLTPDERRALKSLGVVRLMS